MSYFHLKTLLAVVLVAAGLAAALSMLALMGKPDKEMSVKSLRSTHRYAGWTFVLLVVVVAVMGLWHLSAAGDTLPLRGVLHWTLGALLVFLLLLKLVVVKFFKQFLKFAPVMGMAIIVLTLLVATLSAVFFVVTGGRTALEQVNVTERETSAETSPDPDEIEVAEMVKPSATENDDADPPGDAEAGAEIFETNCMVCHHADTTDSKIGPGLAGLFARDSLTLGNRPVTRETVRGQIEDPLGTMPGFEGHLTDAELVDLVTYLETL